MRYISTRGTAPTLDFAEVTLAGLASDGGLYVPEHWPQFSAAEIADMRGLPYAELAARVMRPFVGECLTPDRLRDLCEQARPAATPAAPRSMRWRGATLWRSSCSTPRAASATCSAAR